MNDMTNVAATGVAEELIEQIKDGTAEVVECKSGNLTGKLVTGGIALGATAGAGILGWFLGRRHERKKWEDFEDEDEDLDDIDDIDDEDYVEYVETEPESDTKEAEKTDKPEEK